MPDSIKPLTGYPSVDKPWLKYYDEEARNYAGDSIEKRRRTHHA